MMRCPRCAGLLVDEYVVDPLQDPLSGFQGWRCLNCGTIVDEVIRAHQGLSWPIPNASLLVRGERVWHRLPL
jgi:hypothetical protein